MPSDTSSTPAKATNQRENVETFRATSYRSLLPSPLAVFFVMVLAVLFCVVRQIWSSTLPPTSVPSILAAIINGLLLTVIVSLTQMANRYPTIEISSRGIIRRSIMKRELLVTWGSINLITKPIPTQLHILTIYDQVIIINNGEFGLSLSKIEQEINRYRLAGEMKPSFESDFVSCEWLSNGIVTLAVATIVACAVGSAGYAITARFFPPVQPWLTTGVLAAVVILCGLIYCVRGLFKLPSFKMDANEVAIYRYLEAPIIVPWKQISKIRVCRAENHRATGLEPLSESSDSPVLLRWTTENSRFMLKLIARAKGRGIAVEE